MLMWLNDRSPEASEFAKNFLLHNSGTGIDITGAAKPYTQSGLATVFARKAVADYFGMQPGDPRLPGVFGISQYGTVFTGGTKIAEHGGANPQDRDVPLVVSGDPVGHHDVATGTVETTQIAPTILKLLGLRPSDLQAVRLEHTAVLPLG